MKELTTIITMEITIIQNGNDESVEATVKDNMDENIIKEAAKILANRLGADDVVITKTQNFVMDK